MLDNGRPRVALYCRLAREEDSEMLAQVRTLRAFAKELGFCDCDEYLDNGYSGLSADRPDFTRLYKDICAGRVKVILVKDEARIYRSFCLFQTWLDDVRKQGVEIHTLHGKLEDHSDPLRQNMQKLLEQCGGE